MQTDVGHPKHGLQRSKGIRELETQDIIGKAIHKKSQDEKKDPKANRNSSLKNCKLQIVALRDTRIPHKVIIIIKTATS